MTDQLKPVRPATEDEITSVAKLEGWSMDRLDSFFETLARVQTLGPTQAIRRVQDLRGTDRGKWLEGPRNLAGTLDDFELSDRHVDARVVVSSRIAKISPYEIVTLTTLTDD